MSRILLGSESRAMGQVSSTRTLVTLDRRKLKKKREHPRRYSNVTRRASYIGHSSCDASSLSRSQKFNQRASMAVLTMFDTLPHCRILTHPVQVLLDSPSKTLLKNPTDKHFLPQSSIGSETTSTCKCFWFRWPHHVMPNGSRAAQCGRVHCSMSKSQLPQCIEALLQCTKYALRYSGNGVLDDRINTPKTLVTSARALVHSSFRWQVRNMPSAPYQSTSMSQMI
jgi:hypothetical protein